MSKLEVLIGLPASGKPTYAREKETQGWVVHSSDELRLEMFGSYDVQDKNTELFQELHRRIIVDLKDGKDVIFDATNLSLKKRLGFLRNVPENVHKTAIVFAPLFEDCIKNNKKRDRSVDDDVLLKMRGQFQMPVYGEGYENIEILGLSRPSKRQNRKLSIMDTARRLDQKSIYHAFFLDDHMLFSRSYFIENYGFLKADCWLIAKALEVHDIGKVFCGKERLLSDGTTTHSYIGHENIGAYEYLSIANGNESNTLVATLINYHMLPYNLESEKSKKKWLDILGERVYNGIMTMNECDRAAH